MNKYILAIIIISIIFIFPAVLMAYIELINGDTFTSKQWFIATIMAIIALAANGLINLER